MNDIWSIPLIRRMDACMNRWTYGWMSRWMCTQARVHVDRQRHTVYTWIQNIGWTDGQEGVRQKQRGMLGWYCLSSVWLKTMFVYLRAWSWSVVLYLSCSFLMSNSNMSSTCNFLERRCMKWIENWQWHLDVWENLHWVNANTRTHAHTHIYRPQLSNN